MRTILFVLFALIAVPSSTFSQKTVPAYLTGQGDTIRVGDKVKIGPGTMPDGTYKYVSTIITMNSGYAGMIMTVKAIVRTGDKKIGYSYYLRLFPGAGIVNYQATLDYSIISGEVQLQKNFTPQGKPL